MHGDDDEVVENTETDQTTDTSEAPSGATESHVEEHSETEVSDPGDGAADAQQKQAD